MKLKKQSLRHEIIALCRGLSEAERSRQSRAVRQRVLALPEYQNAASVFCYVSMPDEVDTHELLAHAIEQEKTLCVPAKNENGHMVCAQLERLDDIGRMQRGHFLLPPFTTITPENIQVAIVPGVAFDPDMNRLGRGGGFYDRFLSQTKAFRLGLCFDIQWIDAVPVQPHDIKMHAVVLPDGIRQPNV